MGYLILLGVLVAAFGVSVESFGRLTERFAWTHVDYAFPSERIRQEALYTGLYVPENNLPVGIEVWRNKMFITVPRWMKGVPATLNYIPLDVSYTTSPKLTPYPDWAFNRDGDCDGVTTTYRVRVDECDRLWVLDSGTLGIGNTTEQLCPYAIHVFDLKTDRRLRRYQLHVDDVNADTFIANVAVDVGVSCEDTFMYASDELGYGLIVYSWEQDDSWRLEHSYFMPDPLAGDYNIAGLNFQWGEEGIFGLALSPIQPNGYRILFFHPLSSHREFAVSTEVLRDKSKKEDNYHYFLVLPSRGKDTHITAHTMDPNGLLFFNLIDRNAVGCWDSSKPYSKHNLAIIAKDDVGLVFPSDVRVDKTNTLWVISDRMPVHLIAKLDFTDINFRVFFAPVDELIAGTVCDPSVEDASFNHVAQVIDDEDEYL